MSRLGNRPIPIPENVEVKISPEKIITVKGSKGELSMQVMQGMDVIQEEKAIIVKNISTSDAFHGLNRSLIKNMVLGVTVGFEKKLSLVGVGFRAAVSGNKLTLQIGLSHPTEVEIPKGVNVKVEKSVNIVISGIDNLSVSGFAAQVRSMRPPEPYKGKGIRYENEYVRKKAGKAAKSK